jgi:hypothetical protein
MGEDGSAPSVQREVVGHHLRRRRVLEVFDKEWISTPILRFEDGREVHPTTRQVGDLGRRTLPIKSVEAVLLV